ncbi:uncharacterized protein SETTUDRAFT_169467 [Exserohilum turcica Et28A]|uniref:Uncharacterized protein n=1 Tax=Exserohilum turcicum (strain 28A) TaxID=671987 RepID=R0ILC7_EXST2|nr:uncharacterized protein SETTUDRAFT_169467 [Exserohilum turcica Et28A]EOA85875.1 hypothetical protein SETTUDRAFT_169467 [Exserohilum turcica Et28A]
MKYSKEFGRERTRLYLITAIPNVPFELTEGKELAYRYRDLDDEHILFQDVEKYVLRASS